MEALVFTSEVKKLEAKKLANLDIGYSVTLYTDDPTVLALGALDGNKLLRVTIEVEDD